MERALVAEDPKLASTMRGTTLQRTARRRTIIGGVGFLLGVTVLMTGAIIRITPLGVLGFVIMLGCATMALTAMRDQRAAMENRSLVAPTHHFGIGRSGPSLRERMEERWRRRRDQD